MPPKKKTLPTCFEVPIDMILAFAHKDLPTDFEGLFFRKYNRKDSPIEFQEWRDSVEQDPRYYFSIPPCDEKPPKSAGNIGVSHADYMLIYQHGGTQEIIGTYGAFRSKYYFEGCDIKNKKVKGYHNAWSLSVITNPKDKQKAEFGFLNAASISILSMFYAHGMREVTAEVHETNWRSNSFVRWMGFKNPVHLQKMAHEHGPSRGWLLPVTHKIYHDKLAVILRHMLKLADLRREQYRAKYGHYRDFVFSDTANPIDPTGQKLIHTKLNDSVQQMVNFMESEMERD